jgi:L-malate glycosyltransferase
MKVLWVTNIPINKHCEITNSSSNVGGWMTSTLELLKEEKSIDLCIVTTWPVKKRVESKEANVIYIVLPGGYPLHYKPNKQKNIEEWKQLILQFRPDVVHIHGTEYSPGLSLMQACPNENYIISIQGLCGIIERYYYAGIDISDIFRNITPRDIIKCETIMQARSRCKKRGEREAKYLMESKHVIGRTTWDYVHAKMINRKINYHFCNENLRTDFYETNWQIENIERHTIFMSQTELPYKGIHIALKAISILKYDFEDLKVYIAGSNNIEPKNLKDKIKLNGYSKYLKRLIKEFSLDNFITFTGLLSSVKMAEYYKKSHVFICPSSAENSPNSLGEAQLVGIPCVASYVGGVPDMIKNEDSGLMYRFEEFEMLAHNIRRIFNDDTFALRLSSGGKIAASKRHDRRKNIETILSIYNKIL